MPVAANFRITGDVQTRGNSLALLVLPNGQTILGGTTLYRSASGNPAPDWAPDQIAPPVTASSKWSRTAERRGR